MNSKTLTRRTLLRAAGGVALGLPFLETFSPRKASAAVAAAPKRLVVFFTCSGVNMYTGGDSSRLNDGGTLEQPYDTFAPVTPIGQPLTAASWNGQATAPLAKYYDKILIPRGLIMSPGGTWYGDTQPSTTEGGDHGCAMMSMMTCAKGVAVGGSAPNRANGISLDQLAASQINPGARAAMVLGVEVPRTDSVGYVSYSGPAAPVAPVANPWKAYSDMVASTPAAIGMVDRNALRRKSVLDLLSSEVAALKRQSLSAADKTKLDLHYTAIRDFEVAAQQAGLVACRIADTTGLAQFDPAQPAHLSFTDPPNFPTIGKLHMDVMALALACDYSRVATLQWEAGSDPTVPQFKWINPLHTYAHHPISHHSLDNTAKGDAGLGETSKARQREIDNWFAIQYVSLLDRLAAYSDVNGTLLDNSIVLWATELADAYSHDGIDLPMVIAGSGGGYLKTGAHIKSSTLVQPPQAWIDPRTPHNMLYTTILNALGVKGPGGVPYPQFGIGSPGEISELKA